VPAAEVVGPAEAPTDPRAAEVARELEHRDPAVRAEAARRLGEMGPGARVALRALLKALKDPTEVVRHNAATALRQLGTPGREDLPVLTEALTDEHLATRQHAAEALAKMGAEAKPAAAALLRALKDSDAGVRREAATALGQVGPAVKAEAFRDLLAALSDRDADVRQAAVRAAMRLGAPVAADLPVLRGLLERGDPTGEARSFALLALGYLGPEARSAAPAVVEVLLRADSRRLRLLALGALEKIGPDSKELGGKLSAALATFRSDREMRLALVRVLAKLPAEVDAVPALLEALADRDAAISKAAAGGLGKLADRLDRTHSDRLIAALKSPHPSARRFAAEALGKLGPDAADALPALRALLRDEKSRPVLVEVVRVLYRLGPAARPAGPELAALLRDDRAALRMLSALALTRVDPELAERGKEAVRVLVGTLKASSAKELADPLYKAMLADARQALVKVGKPAVRHLTAALRGEFHGGNPLTEEGQLRGKARQTALEILGEMGPQARSNDLLLLLANIQRSDPFPAVKQAARDTRARVQNRE
jgi:HEAT repeat protein